MQPHHGISRRRILEIAAMGGFALVGRAGGAWAQGAKRIERLAPELEGIIDPSQSIRELATGFGGDIGPAEGPVWIAEGRYLLFNDIHTSRRMNTRLGKVSWSRKRRPTRPMGSRATSRGV